MRTCEYYQIWGDGLPTPEDRHTFTAVNPRGEEKEKDTCFWCSKHRSLHMTVRKEIAHEKDSK